MNIGGFEVKSKAESEKAERDYLLRIFPQGTSQKKKVRDELKTSCPEMNTQDLLFYYISVRDLLLHHEDMAFEQAAELMGRQYHRLKITPKCKAAVRKVMEENQ